MHWYIGVPVLKALLAADPTVTTERFDDPSTYIAITSPGEVSEIPSGWTSVVVETFFNGDDLDQAVAAGQIPPEVKGLVLDDEVGNHDLTPLAEQANPIPLEQQDASAARAKNLTFLDVGDPPASGAAGRYHAAEFAQVVDLQDQTSESDITSFDQMVSQGVDAFHKVNPNAEVLVGITAYLNGGQASPSEILQAVQTTLRDGVGGYWLNCTPCPAPAVSAAASFLQQLS
jgi:hypothetical protein